VTWYLAGYGLLFCLLSAILLLPGAVVAVVAFGRSELRELRPLVTVSLGPAVWMVSIFGLAATGQLRPVAVLVLTLLWVAATLAYWSRLGLAEGLVRTKSALAAQSLLRPAVVALLLAPCFIIAASPEVAWDAGTYHLTLPKLFVAHRGFRAVPMNVYSNWPLNTELLFAGAMVVKDYILATMLHFGFGVLCLYAIHTLCRVFHRPTSAWLAMALFLTNHVVLWEMTIAYIDLAYAFFFVAAFIFALWVIDNRPNRKAALLLCGTSCGILAGTKLSGIMGVVVIAALLALRLPWRDPGGRWAELRSLLVRFALPVLLLASPWLVKSAWYTGNPVYPFMYEWFGGPDWSPVLSEQLAAWQRSIGMGRTVIDYLLLPIRVILMRDVGYARFDGWICRWWILLIPMTLVFGRRTPLVRRCLGAAGLYFVLWSVSSQQMRFLIPILPLLAVGAAVAIDDRIEAMRRHHLRKLVASCCLAAAFLTAAGVNAGHFVIAARFLRRLHNEGGAVRQTAVPPAYRFINHNLPPNARILCLNTNQGFFLDREYLADSFFEASQIADWLRPAAGKSQVMDRLAERGITHVLIEHEDWGIAYPPSLLEVLSDPGLARPVHRSADARFDVLELAHRQGE